MQIAVVSDIHANLQAWNAVLLDIRSLDMDSILCLGDIIGYGPNPAEVLSSVHTNVQHLVLGNHDAVVCGKLNPELFHDSAAELIRWTQTRLNNKAVRFLGSLPLSIACEHFRCCHGDMSDPAAFNYIAQPEDAPASWHAAEGNLFFVGHTHEPAIFILGESGIPRTVEPQDFIVEEHRRYIVNPGSVGQPRDETALASYCIYETETKSVYWRRVPFDLDQYMSSVRAEGLDESVNCFMDHDPRAGVGAAREYTDFSPPRYEADKAAGAMAVQQLDLLASSARRWRSSFRAALAILALLFGTLTTALFLSCTRQLELPANGTPTGHGATLASLGMQAHPALPLSDFNVTLGNRRRQSLKVTENGSRYVLNASSSSYDPIVLQTPEIPVKPGTRLLLEALVRKGPVYDGSECVFISLTRRMGGEAERTPRFLVKEPNMKRQGGYLLAKQTFEVPANTSHISLGMELNFKGDLEIAEILLVKKDGRGGGI